MIEAHSAGGMRRVEKAKPLLFLPTGRKRGPLENILQFGISLRFWNVTLYST